MSLEERTKSRMMDRGQAEWLADEVRRRREAEAEELGGRESGPADWRATRQELGSQNQPKPGFDSQFQTIESDLY
jgi:peptide-N4-(N-acetyl-beta-glucosaminyl)asparagine amidase